MLSVIIVDGNRQSLSFLKEQLPWKQFGCEVVGTAENGIDGRWMIAKYMPGLVITDVNVPSLSGLDMIELTRNINPRGKVIFLADQRSFDDAYRAIKLNADDYLMKPLTRTEMMRSLKRVLENNRIEAATLLADRDPVKLVDKVMEYARNHLSETLTLTVLAGIFNIRSEFLSKLIKETTGMRFSEWITDQRIQRAKELLELGEYRVSEISEIVGYTKYITFYKAFIRTVGYPPSCCMKDGLDNKQLQEKEKAMLV